MEFAAKVDLWFLLLFYGSGLLMIGMALFLPMPQRFARILLVPLGIVFMGVAYTADRMVIVITPDGYLDSRGWPYTGRITPIDQIRRVEPSNDPRSSLAASLDRLRVDYGHGGLIFIAVEDESGFLDALAKASDQLQRTPDGVQRVSAAAESPGSRSGPRTSDRAR